MAPTKQIPPLLDEALMLDDALPLATELLDEEDVALVAVLVPDAPPAPSWVVTVPPHAAASATSHTGHFALHLCIRCPQYPASFFKRK
jgi:hypothetical protein